MMYRCARGKERGSTASVQLMFNCGSFLIFCNLSLVKHCSYCVGTLSGEQPPIKNICFPFSLNYCRYEAALFLPPLGAGTYFVE